MFARNRAAAASPPPEASGGRPRPYGRDFLLDVQYGDFLLLAMDQIVNNIAKMRYVSGGQIKVPIVMRAPIGATGRGSQHAQSLERFVAGVPGLKVVAVSTR